MHFTYTRYTEIGADTEKVASMQALLADNFCKNCGHFCINNEFLAVFILQLPQVCISYPQLIYFSSKISNLLENNFNLGHFYMIRIYMNLRIFFNPENWLADKNQLFPCLRMLKFKNLIR